MATAEPTAEHDASRPAFDRDRLALAVEAILLTMDKPLPATRIAEAVGLTPEEGGPKAAEAAIESLNAHYEETDRSFRIEQVAGGYRVMTLPEFAPAVAAVQGLRESGKLTRAALETLAIVAYRQPVTRSQIETIRGAASGDVLRNLLDRRLIAIVGRAEELGRPMLYGTSKRFLEVFGLRSIKDLPPVGDVFPDVNPVLAGVKPGTPPAAGASDTPESDSGGAEPGDATHG